MLSRFSHAAGRALTSTIELGVLSLDPEGGQGELLEVNVDELCEFVRPLPQLAWSAVTGMCTRTFTPVYRCIRDTLNDDLEEFAMVLQTLETSRNPEAHFEPAERDVVPSHLSHPSPPDCPEDPLPSRPRPGRRRSQSTDLTVLFENDDPSLPRIIVTPCATLPRESTCLVPYQDAAFGNRLPVPNYPALNDVFPPLVARPFPLVEHWHYQDGHWRAQLPPVQEQITRGMFARPLSSRRQRAEAQLRTRPPRGRICYSRSSHREG